MGVEEAFTRGPLVVVVAHPDDETIAVGGILPRFPVEAIIHVTDGAPRNLSGARDAGFERREDYAAARRTELLNSMSEAGVAENRLHSLGVIDQEASFQMGDIARKLGDLLAKLHAATVLTHVYEGGHPDHDSTAWAVHAACARVAPAARIWEFAGYHARDGAMEIGLFPAGGDQGEAIVLTEEARERKRRMFECFGTQSQMLRNFPIDAERFRPAPAYDFALAPHSGQLLYEQFDWGMTGIRWRALAAAATAELGLGATL
jgi:LmbE family N-acetylglucosaminyl deacetylase